MATKNLPGTLELWVFICKGVAGSPPDEFGVVINTVEGPCIEKPVEQWSEVGYWAVAYADSPGFPDVLAHIRIEGQLPPEKARDRIARHIQAMLGTTLFGHEIICPECHSPNLAEVWALDLDEDGEVTYPQTAYICEKCGWEFVVRRHLQ